MSETAAPAAKHAMPATGSTTDLKLQRSCDCGQHTPGGHECDGCRDKRHRQPEQSLGVGGGAASPDQQGPPAGADPNASGEQLGYDLSGVRTLTASSGLLVNDDTTDLTAGQMHKSEFMAQLEETVRSTVESTLAGTEHSAEGCPYLDYWFDHYRGRDSAAIERAIHLYAPETARSATALDYVPLVAERVRLGVARWALTGEIAGVPAEAHTALPDTGAGQAESTTRTMTFQAKGRAGGPRAAGSPADIAAELGSGRPLAGPVRTRMESAFGRSFGHVRAHTDTRAANLSSALNSHAFTVGHHVAFGSGEYRPGTVVGDALIAHELAHVAQQEKASSTTAPMRVGSEGYHALEEDADHAAFAAVTSLWAPGSPEHHGHTTPRLRSGGPRLQRCKSSPTMAERVKDLQFLDTGAMQGPYGISQYWSTVTPYWGTDNTLGQFDTTRAGGWHAFGHKFQVVGTFERVPAPTAGSATFQQEARLTTGTSRATAGSPGAWFDDFNYVDAAGKGHHWGINAEVGTTDASGYTGVRRTIAPDKYAYTDPPSVAYKPGITNSYRNLEFRIHFRSAPGVPGGRDMTLQRSQEIEVAAGVPNVLKYPGP
jgi:hypothetical protein